MRKITYPRSRFTQFWNKTEAGWNDNRLVAWTLALIALAFVVWAWFRPQSPGVSIGLLALAAGLMSIRPKMHPAEKTAWAAVLIAFAILEVKAIKRNDDENKSARETQNAKFAAIAVGLSNSYTRSQQQFVDTMGSMGKVFNKTKEAADTATDAVNTMTGGKGFCYIELATVVVRGQKIDDLGIMLTVKGAKFLHGVSAHIVDYKAFMADTSKVNPMTVIERDAVNTSFGDVRGSAPIFQPIGIVTQGKTEIDYLINFSALNGNWTEEMHYKIVKGNLEHATRVLWHKFPPSGDVSKVRDTVVLLDVSKGYPLKDGKAEWLPIKQP